MVVLNRCQSKHCHDVMRTFIRRLSCVFREEMGVAPGPAIGLSYIDGKKYVGNTECLWALPGFRCFIRR